MIKSIDINDHNNDKSTFLFKQKMSNKRNMHFVQIMPAATFVIVSQGFIQVSIKHNSSQTKYSQFGSFNR